MNEILKHLQPKAKSKKRDFDLLLARLKKMKPQKVDEIFHRLHQEAFEEIDCLECANCCKGLGPRIERTDIDRMAAYLKMKTSRFMDEYIRTDEDGDLVFQSMPCPFIMPDNYCMIYPSRPKACREYPHTDRKNMKGILKECLKNTETCPAVYHVFEKLPRYLP